MTLPHRITAEQFNKLHVRNGSLSVKANKYGVSDASQRTYGGRLYASKAEMAKAQELDMLVNAGIVDRWFPQPRFALHVKGSLIGHYVADFKVVYADGRVEHLDVKGFMPELCRWKLKMLKAEYGIDVVITR